jgi:hypothetical protein
MTCHRRGLAMSRNMGMETAAERMSRQARDALAMLSAKSRAIRERRRLLERLFGPVDRPTKDGRMFLLMLAEMAQFGATEIAETDRQETARAAQRALVNKLLLAWSGDPLVIERLRDDQARLEEENPQ